MDIRVAQEGWKFVISCMKRYQGEGFFLVLFLIALCYLAFHSYWKKDKTKVLFAGWAFPYFLILLVTVFNIFLMPYIVVLLGMEDEYYRFLWILPVTVTIGFAAACWVTRNKNIFIAAGKIVVLAAVIIITGKTILARGFSLAENRYKVPDEVIAICDMIQDDSEAENPKVVAEFDLVVLLNQYDPSIQLEISYGDVSTLRDVEADFHGGDWDRWLTARLTVMNVVMDHDISIPDYDFEAAMDYTEAFYLVAQKNEQMETYYEGARCIAIGMTENYIVYRYYNSILPLPA